MKKKKLDLKLNIEKEECLNENYDYLYNKLTFNPLLRVGLVLVLLIISIIFSKRIDKLSSITSIAIFGKSGLLTSASYFVILIFTMVICLSVSLFSIYVRKKYKEITIDFLKTSYLIYNIYDMAVFIISSISVVLFTIMVIITPCNISGDSMNYTYYDKDKVLVFSLFYEPNNDDVIVFDSKDYVSHERYESRFYIKPVVATENDTIRYDSVTKYLYINNIYIEEVSISEYNRIIKSINLDENTLEFIVPKDKVLVFGDNRSNSIDSRSFGFIDEECIIGKVFVRIAPLSDFGNPKPNIKE